MKLAWTLVGSVVVALMVAGCGDSKSSEKTASTPPKQGAGNPLTAPVDYLGAVGAAHKQAAKTVDLTSLQQSVKAFQAGEDRLPSSLQEMVSEGYLPRIPAAPKGMEWVYQPQSGQIRVVSLPPLPGP